MPQTELAELSASDWASWTQCPSLSLMDTVPQTEWLGCLSMSLVDSVSQDRVTWMSQPEPGGLSVPRLGDLDVSAWAWWTQCPKTEWLGCLSMSLLDSVSQDWVTWMSQHEPGWLSVPRLRDLDVSAWACWTQCPKTEWLGCLSMSLVDSMSQDWVTWMSQHEPDGCHIHYIWLWISVLILQAWFKQQEHNYIVNNTHVLNLCIYSLYKYI